MYDMEFEFIIQQVCKFTNYIHARAMGDGKVDNRETVRSIRWLGGCWVIKTKFWSNVN
jgi:hypothetical protein